MNPEYEAIINMTNEEAATIITDLQIRVVGGRDNGKSITTLRTNMALSKAIDVLMEKKEKHPLEQMMDDLEAGKITPNQAREQFGFPLVEDRKVLIKDTIPIIDKIPWIIVSSGKLPDTGDRVLISLWIDWSYGNGTDIQHTVDMGTFSEYEGYIGVIVDDKVVGYFDTDNDWREGQPVKILAWYDPTPYKEEEVK